jgi:hypothetical protein
MGPTQHLGTQGELELIDQGFAQQAGRQAGSAQHQQSLVALGGEPGKQARPRLQKEVSLEPWWLAWKRDSAGGGHQPTIDRLLKKRQPGRELT